MPFLEAGLGWRRRRRRRRRLSRLRRRVATRPIRRRPRPASGSASAGRRRSAGPVRTAVGGGSGGGVGRAVGCTRASSASSRARSSAAWLSALRATMKRDDRDQQRKEIERRIEHQVSRRSARHRWAHRHQMHLQRRAANAQARRRPLLQHLAAEAKQRGGPAAGLCRHHAGRFDQGAGFHQPAEILLVQMPPRDRLHGPLQFGECELGRQKFKHHRAVFQFGAQPRNRGGENAAVVEAHGDAERGQRLARQCRRRGRRGAPPRPVPLRRAARSGRARAPRPNARPRCRNRAARDPCAASARAVSGCSLCPAHLVEFGKDVALDDGGPRLAPVLPGEEAVPGLEGRARRARAVVVGGAGQREIADRGDMDVGVAGLRVPAAIAEGVELLDIAEPQARSALPPRRAGRSRRCGARPHRTGRTEGPASLSPSLPEAVRISGSLPSIATIAAVRPISIGVRSLSLIWRRRCMRISRARRRNGLPSTIMLAGPISSSARTMRPSRPSALSARPTISRLGEAIGEAARSFLRDLHLVAMRIEHAGRGKGARGGAADAGIAMDHHRRAAVPAAHEVSTCSTCASDGRDIAVHRLGDVVHRDLRWLAAKHRHRPRAPDRHCPSPSAHGWRRSGGRFRAGRRASRRESWRSLLARRI